MPENIITHDRRVYRQCNPDGGDPPFYNPKSGIHHSLFRPGNRDFDGLSFIRIELRTPIWAAYRIENPEIRFLLINLSCVDLSNAAANLSSQSFVDTPDEMDNRFGEPWAHCVFAGANLNDYKSDPAKTNPIRVWAKKVAAQINQNQISGPFLSPSDQDSYRPT